MGICRWLRTPPSLSLDAITHLIFFLLFWRLKRKNNERKWKNKKKKWKKERNQGLKKFDFISLWNDTKKRWILKVDFFNKRWSLRKSSHNLSQKWEQRKKNEKEEKKKIKKETFKKIQKKTISFSASKTYMFLCFLLWFSSTFRFFWFLFQDHAYRLFFQQQVLFIVVFVIIVQNRIPAVILDPLLGDLCHLNLANQFWVSKWHWVSI